MLISGILLFTKLDGSLKGFKVSSFRVSKVVDKGLDFSEATNYLSFGS